MNPYPLGAVILALLTVSACKLTSVNPSREDARFCTKRLYQGPAAQAGIPDEIEFRTVHRAVGGAIFSDCLFVELVTPSSIQIVGVDGASSTSGRAHVLVDGEPLLKAMIGDSELVQLKVDARPGRNVVLLEIDGRPVEWEVFVRQSIAGGPGRNQVLEVPTQPGPEHSFDPAPEPEPETVLDPEPTPQPETGSDAAPDPQPTPIPAPSYETNRLLEVITVGDGDRVLIDLNSTPMTILEMKTNADGTREMVEAER